MMVLSMKTPQTQASTITVTSAWKKKCAPVTSSKTWRWYIRFFSYLEAVKLQDVWLQLFRFLCRCWRHHLCHWRHHFCCCGYWFEWELEEVVDGKPEVGSGLPLGAEVDDLCVWIEAEASDRHWSWLVGRVLRPLKLLLCQVVQLRHTEAKIQITSICEYC